jgi:Holliday junction DNA helicase RuvA
LAQPLGTPISIHTHLQVKEDSHTLFGFDDYSQKVLFKLLIGVSGVGPKSAFGILSFSTAAAIIEAIRANDTAFFSRVPGLGKKTAMKIIVELSSKLEGAIDESKLFVTDETKTVIDALVALGYPAADARHIVHKLPNTLTVEQMITEALKMSGK